MSRQNEGPWFRRSKGTWYTKLDGKQVALGVKGKANRKAAWEVWKKLVAEGSKPKAEHKHEAPSVRQMVDSFLKDAEGRMTTGCLRNYRIYLQAFANKFGEHQTDAVTFSDAEAFARKPEWSDTYRANCLGCLSTLYRWAVRQGLLFSNPMVHLRKPTKQSRGASAVISEAEHQRLIAVADTLMRDYLTTLWLTNARPGEIAGLTAEQVRTASNGIIPPTVHKTAHKGKARFLILAPEALNILKARAEVEGSGLVFSGRDGKLTAQAIGSRMRTLCGRAGLRRLTVYGYRHGYATEALAKGVPDATVATLLGHSDTSMLHRHYGHLTSRTQALKDAVAKVR